MAAARQSGRQRGEWSTFFAVLLAFAFLAAWALIPPGVLETTWQGEQRQMTQWAGQQTNRWIVSKAAGSLRDAAMEAWNAADGLGGGRYETWMTERLYVTLLWANLVLYRAHTLLMWGLLGIPLILAASVDGFYVREIRKTAFVSQSPMRHMLGVRLFRLVTVAMLIWLCLPAPMPIMVAPLVIALAAVSLWLWVANLQKRL